MRLRNVANTHDTRPFVSRRMWLAGLGGGLMSVPFLWWFNVPRREGASSASAETALSAYVDQDGWMLTPDDVTALAARRPAP